MLLVAATERELCSSRGSEALCCGIGPVEAALATAHALALHRPSFVLHVGVAGARRLPPPTLVLGSASLYVDLEAGLRLPHHARVAPDGRLLAAARRLLPQASVEPIATSARLGGGSALEVEAMEGFGVLRAAAAVGVPALELRAVSNLYTDARADWRIDEALEALGEAVAVLAAGLDA